MTDAERREAGQIAALRADLAAWFSHDYGEVPEADEPEGARRTRELLADTEAAAEAHDARIRREALLEVAKACDAEVATAVNDYGQGQNDTAARLAMHFRALADSPPPASGGAPAQGEGMPFATAADSGASGGSAVQLGASVGSQAPPSTTVAAGGLTRLDWAGAIIRDCSGIARNVADLVRLDAERKRSETREGSTESHFETGRMDAADVIERRILTALDPSILLAAPTRADSPPTQELAPWQRRQNEAFGLASPPIPPSEPRANLAFRGDHLLRALREWAADSREREGWKDADRSTYKFRANVLEGAIAEITDARAALAACHEAIGESPDSDDATLAEGIRLRLVARPGEGLAEWYEAYGSVTMLPAAEVIRLRKLAAVVLEKARRVVAAPDGAFAADEHERLDDLAGALRTLDAAADRKEPQP